MDLENKYGTLEIQKECVKLLQSFHSFCVDNGISYSIAYGTLLGAVRHKGFIPWDDDIDIIVDRDNYEMILNAISSSGLLSLERITSHTLWTDRITFIQTEYSGPYAPTIDIFLLDHSPDNLFLAKLKLYTIYALQGMIKYRLSLKKGGLIMKLFAIVTFLLGRPFSHKTKYSWYQKVSMLGNDKPTENEQCYNTLFNYISCRFKSGLLSDIGIMPFEDIEVYAMKGYDSFLTSQYGDYMTPPKEKKPQHMK